ncbi:MAG TPA: hypothetical protein VGJ13_16575 [Pseudonocardiaceae bacterium]
MASCGPLRRVLLGPVMVTGALVVGAMIVTAATVVTATSIGSVVGEGWELPWLLLGLTAGYALSGSA